MKNFSRKEGRLLGLDKRHLWEDMMTALKHLETYRTEELRLVQNTPGWECMMWFNRRHFRQYMKELYNSLKAMNEPRADSFNLNSSLPSEVIQMAGCPYWTKET